MAKKIVSRNYIVIVSSEAEWKNFLIYHPDLQKALKHDQNILNSQLLPAEIQIEKPTQLKRISFFNQRTVHTIQELLKPVAIYCQPDLEDHRNTNFRSLMPKRRKGFFNFKCSCQSSTSSCSLKQKCEPSQDVQQKLHPSKNLKDYEVIYKEVKQEEISTNN
jgi:hypothetical protein